MKIDPLAMSIFDDTSNQCKQLPGNYKIAVGTSSDDTALHQTMYIH